MSDSVDVGSAEGRTSLLSNGVYICVKPLLRIHNCMSSTVRCSLSLSSTSLRTAGRQAEILF